MGKAKSSSSSSSRSPKIERKIIEKDRRNRMKILYSNLLSLLPDHGSKQVMPLPDQIDEVVKYIESLKMKVEKMKEKKQSLSLRKRSRPCIISEIPPLLEVLDMGPTMDVILVTGLDDLSKFYRILHSLCEDGIEVVYANFSIHGYSTIHILHDKIGKSSMGFEVTTMSRRLNHLICGSTCSESDIWGYHGIPDFIDPYMHEFGLFSRM